MANPAYQPYFDLCFVRFLSNPAICQVVVEFWVVGGLCKKFGDDGACLLCVAALPQVMTSCRVCVGFLGSLWFFVTIKRFCEKTPH